MGRYSSSEASESVDRDQERIKGIKDRLVILANDFSQESAVDAATNHLVFHDVMWLLEKMGEDFDPRISRASLACYCEYADVGVGGQGLRVQPDPDCPEHSDPTYRIKERFASADLPPLSKTLEAANRYVLSNSPSRDKYYPPSEYDLIRDLASHLSQNVIPRNGETIKEEFAIIIEGSEPQEVDGRKAANFLASDSSSIEIAKRWSMEGKSEWRIIAKDS